MPMLKPTNDQVSANIRAEIARKSMTQTELAAGLGIHQSALSERLRGRVSWRLEELTTAAEILGVTFEQLCMDPAAT